LVDRFKRKGFAYKEWMTVLLSSAEAYCLVSPEGMNKRVHINPRPMGLIFIFKEN
jgi:hypothetical protein